MVAANASHAPTPPVAPDLASMPNSVSTKGLRWIFEKRGKWELSLDQVAELLGGLSVSTVKDWKRRIERDEVLDLPRDVVERISLLLGIHKSLAILTPMDQADLAWGWFRTSTELFDLQGRSIRDYLLEAKTMESLYFIRRQLDAERG